MIKVKKIMGRLLYAFTRYLPASTSRIQLGQKAIRGFCGKLILMECGENVNIERNATFDASVRLGNHSGLGVNCKVGSCTQIGDNVMMGPNVNIYSQNHRIDRTDIPMCRQGFEPIEPVVIGDDVWIGEGVIICPGSRIGNGVVLGAGTVVRGNIPDYAVVIGNPGIIIKYRR